jgi:hypothetical protein
LREQREFTFKEKKSTSSQHLPADRFRDSNQKIIGMLIDRREGFENDSTIGAHVDGTILMTMTQDEAGEVLALEEQTCAI